MVIIANRRCRGFLCCLHQFSNVFLTAVKRLIVILIAHSLIPVIFINTVFDYHGHGLLLICCRRSTIRLASPTTFKRPE
jgi:hypothetical protein